VEKNSHCQHKHLGIRYTFSPSAEKKILAVTYCKDCKKEISKEVVTAPAKDKDSL